ncbi:MAG: bifunctional 2',3'-cyclic-nucleotide 2'-phosphodiesterase/3'-nucleotidase [Mangrovicoccus sp.]
MSPKDHHPLSQQETRLRLRVLATSDLHANMRSFDYISDTAAPNAGLAALSSVIDHARQECANCLLLDNGDLIQGQPLGDWAAEEIRKPGSGTHPIIAALNGMGYDAANLGNHEFNYGLETLDAAYRGAEFPVICSNAAYELGETPCQDRTLRPPWVILERQFQDEAGQSQNLKIGLIGFLPPQILAWDKTWLEDRLSVRDIIASAKAYLPMIKQAGADIVVALCHSGIGPDNAQDGMENAAVPLAAIAGIDALITGHTHLCFPDKTAPADAVINPIAGTIHGKPTVMPGAMGARLGVIDLWLQQEPDGWHVAQSQSELRSPTPSHADRPPKASPLLTLLLDNTEQAHEATRDYLAKEICISDVDLHSYFWMLGHSPADSVVAQLKIAALQDYIADSEFADLPVLAAVSTFKGGGRHGAGYYTHIPPGRLRRRHVSDLYIFPNLLGAIRVTGAELHDWLERSFSGFTQLSSEQPDQLLWQYGVPHYDLDVVHGAEWDVDLSQAPRYDAYDGELISKAHKRIRNLTVNRRAVSDADEFIIAANSYRLGGSSGFPLPGSEWRINLPENLLIRDVLETYLGESAKAPMPQPSPWQLHAPKGSSAVFATSPNAAKFAPQLENARLELLNDGHNTADSSPGNSFATYRLHF